MKHLALYAALMAAPLPALAQQFNVGGDSGRADSFSFNLNATLTETAFTHRLRIPITPAEILQTDFMTATGQPLQFRMLADSDLGLIFGTPVDGLQLELITRLDGNGQPQYVVIGRQGDVLYDLSADDLFVTDLKFGNYCFTLEPLEQAGVPLNVEMAVDVSGSMHSAVREVRQSLLDFTTNLPTGARCRATLFNDTSRQLRPPGVQPDADGTYACQAFADSTLLNQQVVTSGGTDIVTPLSTLYRRLARAQERVNLAVVISDGLGAARRNSPEFRQLQALRNKAVEDTGAYTVVLWRGRYKQNYPLGDLADASVIGPLNSTDAISDFFRQSQALLAAQRVITPVSCG